MVPGPLSSPALVAADHVAVVVREAADAAGDVGPVAAVFRSAERGAARRLVLPPQQYAVAGTDQHCRRGRGGGCGRGPRPIVVVLPPRERRKKRRRRRMPKRQKEEKHIPIRFRLVYVIWLTLCP